VRSAWSPEVTMPTVARTSCAWEHSSGCDSFSVVFGLRKDEARVLFAPYRAA